MGYQSELDTVLQLVRTVGAEVMKIYDSEHGVETKDDESPLTKADRLSHEMLTEALEHTDYGIVSEESENIRPEKTRQWIIDPLDGTYDFIQQTGEFSIMIGLLDDGRPVLGVVYAPAMDKLWYAVEGSGAYVIESGEERRIQVSGRERFEEYRMVISRNHFRQQDKDIADRLGITNFEKMGSVGVKFGGIAEGKADLCAYTTNKMGLWDDCASHVILKEAGGEVFDIDGKEPLYNLSTRRMERGFIGTNGKNREAIIQAVQEGLE